MITFIISLVLITNQNDLKGFENKETAEYYAKIIGCEGYFESNINNYLIIQSTPFIFF